LTVVIPNFATVHTVDYGAQAAATVVATVPLVILVLFFQRRIVSGLTAGAVKG
jgi:ABC-type glycerol-3-phosphate transport system permease component